MQVCVCVCVIVYVLCKYVCSHVVAHACVSACAHVYEGLSLMVDVLLSHSSICLLRQTLLLNLELTKCLV